MTMQVYSPVVPLLYAFALLWITMDGRFRDLTPLQNGWCPY